LQFDCGAIPELASNRNSLFRHSPVRAEVGMNTNVKRIRKQDGQLLLMGPCTVTKKLYSVVVSDQAVVNYYQLGMKAQDAFPELSAEQREFLISGISPEGWKQIFGTSDSSLEQSEA
jgi:hypothetical protein